MGQIIHCHQAPISTKDVYRQYPIVDLQGNHSNTGTVCLQNLPNSLLAMIMEYSEAHTVVNIRHVSSNLREAFNHLTKSHIDQINANTANDPTIITEEGYHHLTRLARIGTEVPGPPHEI